MVGGVLSSRVVTSTPEQRLARLIRNARRGWQLAAHDPQVRERARQWLAAHPSTMPEVDAMWTECLSGTGALHDWLNSAAPATDWPHSLPLHSLLAGHPFPDQPQWVEVPR